MNFFHNVKGVFMEESRYSIKYPFEKKEFIIKVVTLGFLWLFVLLSVFFTYILILYFMVATCTFSSIGFVLRRRKVYKVLEELKSKGRFRLHDFKESHPYLTLFTAIIMALAFMIIIGMSRSPVVLGGGLGLLSGWIIVDVYHFLVVNHYEKELNGRIIMTIISREMHNKMYVAKEISLVKSR